MAAKSSPTRSLRRTLARSALLSTIVLVACGGGATEPLAEAIMDCGADHPLVGSTATLETHFHQVAGVATIVDNCTVEIADFVFDGQGLDVRAVLSDDADFESYDVLSEDLRGDGPYEGEPLTLPLREGMTLDGVSHLSIWCVPAGASFGDGAFTLP